MPLVEALPVGPTVAQWPVWSTTARLVVTDASAVGAARDLVERELAQVDRACSRFRDDSEIMAVARAGGAPMRVSPLLAQYVAVALDAARRTDGDVDPTLGSMLSQLGYDRDFAGLDPAAGQPEGVRPAAGGSPPSDPTRRVPQLRVLPAAGWQDVRLDGTTVQVPAGIVLDLGATAKAYTADRCAQLIAAQLGVGALVSLGGDLATAGVAPDGGWQVLIQDAPDDPRCTVGLPEGVGLATSSTISRSWRQGVRRLHHILDPRTSQPAEPVWRTVSVAAFSCLLANTYATAAIVRGRSAPQWLREQPVAARLIDQHGVVTTINGWPAQEGVSR
jgi:thiamine biosynthesis lipoprotein